MRAIRFFVKSVFYICFIAVLVVFTSVITLNNSISKDYKVKRGNDININSFLPVTAVYNGTEISQSRVLETVGEEYNVDLKIFGIIPVSTVKVQIVDEMHVALLGQPFGMKLYTDGVLVIDITDIETENGLCNPAKVSGIKKGDYILSVNGKEIHTNEDLSSIVEKSKGEKLNLKVKRKNKILNLKIKPEISKETENYKIGVWVRDSSAGIGTLTFYSPATEVICGLGHGICDEDTGTLLELNSGEIVNAEIISVEKGEKGSPGQLKGRFGYKTLGEINLNSNLGVYSILNGNIDTSNLAEIALKQEVSNGEAQIYCTLEGEKPQYYNCEIEIRTSAYMSKTQNMIITVTDEILLSKSGGIVQGMSGSPIIQNGKLVGAVTHVLVDDPTKGYGIFAENMLETAQIVAEEQLKDAS